MIAQSFVGRKRQMGAARCCVCASHVMMLAAACVVLAGAGSAFGQACSNPPFTVACDPLLLHGLGGNAACQPVCVGEVVNCRGDVRFGDDFADAWTITSGNATVDGVLDPPAGNLPIVGITGNAVCTDSGGVCNPATGANCVFPCTIGPAGLMCTDGARTLPGVPSGGRVTVTTTAIAASPGAKSVVFNFVGTDNGTDDCANTPTLPQSTNPNSTFNPPNCNDGDACTVDCCAAGVCTHPSDCVTNNSCRGTDGVVRNIPPITCNDGDPCTTDTCVNDTDPATDCCSTAPILPCCGDGDVTPPETCDPPGGATCPGGLTCGATCLCPEACCLPNGTCISTDPASCIAQGGTPEGPGTVCTTVQGCCLPDNTCVDLDPLCCIDRGGTPEGPGTVCTTVQGCCLPDGTCQNMDPLCCIDQGGTPEGPGSACTTVQGCCLPDNTCVDLDPLCCVDLGGTPEGLGTACTIVQGCCLPDGTCQDMDPLCCVDLNGIVQMGPCAGVTCGNEAICRTPGFWGSHANNTKRNSQNITQAVIDACGGVLDVCGECISTTVPVNDAASAVEALCVSPKGQIVLQNARQLTALALNCCISGFGQDCGDDPGLSGLLSDCNNACQGLPSTRTNTRCRDEIDCFNNGGQFDPITGMCGDGGPDNCHTRKLVNEDLRLNFDPPGSAGSSDECHAAKGNHCAILPLADCNAKNKQGEDCCGTDALDTCAPECTGATCLTFIPCNPGTTCPAPICATTAEGGGVCVEGSTPCAGLAPCVTTADCLDGVCAVETCCGSPVCIPVAAFCPESAGAAAVPPVNSGTGPTVGGQ